MAARKWYSLRWKILIAMFVLLIWAIGYAGWRIHLVTRILPMGEGPAGPAIETEAFAERWSDGKYILVGVGDSITRGLGTSKQLTYFELLIKNSNEEYPDMQSCELSSVLDLIECKNFARDYTTSQEHIDDQLPMIPIYSADVHGIVVITSGGNDLIHDYGKSEPRDGAMYGCSYKQGIVWTENIKKRVNQLIDGVREKFPGGCDIFLANIYDPTDGVSDPQIVGLPRWPAASRVLNLTNAKIKEICDSYDDVHLVDIHSTFLGHGLHCTEKWRKHYRKDDPTHWYFYNLEDPNRRGYDAIRRLYLKKIIQVIADKS